MKYDLILFDFDGTLADSERAMLDALNSVAAEFGFEPLVREENTRLHKLSMREFVTKRLHIPLWRVWTLLRLERKAKEAFALRASEVELFPEAAGTIASLREAGATVGIVSSAPTVVIETALRAADVSVDFVRAGIHTFSKPRALRGVLRERSVAGGRALYIGDELRDADACRRVGIEMLGVSWGLNDEPTLRAAGVEVALTWDAVRMKILSS